jgi:hypothetical protein
LIYKVMGESKFTILVVLLLALIWASRLLYNYANKQPVVAPENSMQLADLTLDILLYTPVPPPASSAWAGSRALGPRTSKTPIQQVVSDTESRTERGHQVADIVFGILAVDEPSSDQQQLDLEPISDKHQRAGAG